MNEAMKETQLERPAVTVPPIPEYAWELPERIAPPRLPEVAEAPPAGRFPARRYTYRSPWVRGAFRSLDAAGGLLLHRSRPRPEAIRRVLLMRPDHLGDVLFSLPAVAALREHLPNAQIDLLVGPWARPVLEMAGVEGVDPLEFAVPWLLRPKKVRFGLRATAALAGFLRRRVDEIEGRYDLAVDLRGDFQLILAARLARVGYLVGRGVTGLGFALDAEAEEVPGRHQVEGNFAVLETAGFGPFPTANPRIALSREQAEEGRELLKHGGVDPSKLLIGVHPGAGQPEKRWPPERFARLVERVLADSPARVLLLGGPDDRPQADALLGALGGKSFGGQLVDVCGRLPDLAAFMKVVSQCRLFVGNDSGPVHLAAALGVPVVCVFQGPNDPAEWGPRGARVMILRSGAAPAGSGGLPPPPVEPVFQAVRRCV